MSIALKGSYWTENIWRILKTELCVVKIADSIHVLAASGGGRENSD